MREYFDAEMRLLHEAAREFSQAYPEQAGMLNMDMVKDRDPYVERLLEGVAYLSAQIRQTIDDDIPEGSEGLLSLMWPHFLRPMPSMTIMEFNPRIGQLQQTQILPRHSNMLSTPVSYQTVLGQENVTCRYRTVYDVELHPVRLHRVTATEPGAGGTIFKFHFKLDPGARIEALDLKRLKVYLHTDPNIAVMLYKALVSGVDQVQVRLSEDEKQLPVRLGGQDCVQPCHLGPRETLVPSSGQSFYGFHLLHEYFSFREKYLFVSLEGLDKVDWPKKCSEFELEIHSADILPRDVEVSAEMFRLYCAPAINLYQRTAEPVRLTQRRYDYPVIGDMHTRFGVEVYSIDEVTGIDVKTGDRTSYNPLYAFDQNDSGKYYYTSRKVLGSGRPETYITVGDNGNFLEQNLSCEITATNAHVPRAHLQVGSINTPGVDFPGYVSLRNITRPTRMLNPPDREAFQWSLISHMALNYSSLADTDVLRKLLALYEWTQESHNQRRIRGVEVTGLKPVDIIRKGALMRGTEILLRLSDEAFGSTADSYLFGMVLHQFFTCYASINTFMRTRVETHPSHEEFIWQPTRGAVSPI